MSVFEESGLEFDFSAAISATKHDTVNTVFKGVDFVVTDRDGHLWVEVKSWSPNVIPPHRRGGQRRSYLSKMGRLGRRGGTLTGAPPNAPVRYVMLLESVPTDAALRSHLMTRMRNVIRRQGAASPWTHPVEVAVVDVAEWSARFSMYSVTWNP